jgi:hypothetical protein
LKFVDVPLELFADQDLPLLRLDLRQPETLISQVRRDGKAYPADPKRHDRAFDRDTPSAEEASGMKEGDESENRRGAEGKGPLDHVDLAEEKSCSS